MSFDQEMEFNRLRSLLDSASFAADSGNYERVSILLHEALDSANALKVMALERAA